MDYDRSMPDPWGPLDLVPGLWAGLLAAALAGALRRWFDPVPPRALGAFGLAIAVLLGPALFGGRVLLPLDLLARTPPYGDLDLERPAANSSQADLVLEVAPWLAQVRRAYSGNE